jgi:hypothetical protein
MIKRVHAYVGNESEFDGGASASETYEVFSRVHAYDGTSNRARICSRIQLTEKIVTKLVSSYFVSQVFFSLLLEVMISLIIHTFPQPVKF